MRTRTSPENTILAAAVKAVPAVKVEIKDAAGVYQDWFPYLLSVSWGASVDQPIAEVRLELKRDNGLANSLSPFRGDSTLNIGGAAIDAGRDIRISPATTAWGTAPVSGDYKLLFQGKIVNIDFANATMEILARDQGGALVQRQIKTASEFRSEAGEPLEDVIQDLLDLWAPGTTLFTPVSPGFNVTSIDWGKGSVFDAIRMAAGKIGWDIRYLWDDGTSAFRLTLYEPDRAKTTPDWTFAANRYFRITQLAINPEGVRNYIQVSYLNTATGMRETVEAHDDISIARFGEQWMEIEEANSSPINTTAEAQALADAALADLAWPVADKQVEVPFFWPVDIGDLIRFVANGVHSDEDIDLAVTGYQHRLYRKSARTTLTLRGKPSGFYRDWLRRSKGSIGEAQEPSLGAPILDCALTHDGTLLTVQLSVMDSNATYWKCWTRKDFPPMDDDDVPEEQFLVWDDSMLHTSFSHRAVGGTTWYAVVQGFDASGAPGPVSPVRSIATGSGTAALANVGVATVGSPGPLAGHRIFWDHNTGAATGHYLNISVSIDGATPFSVVTNRDPTLEGTSGDTLPLAGYYARLVDRCTLGSAPECIWRRFDYVVELRRTSDDVLIESYSAQIYDAALA